MIYQGDGTGAGAAGLGGILDEDFIGDWRGHKVTGAVGLIARPLEGEMIKKRGLRKSFEFTGGKQNDCDRAKSDRAHR